MALYKYGSSSKSVAPPVRTEFDILKASHKFLREDDSVNKLSWDEQLAKKYYSNLYREYAVCDLKHYKSGNFALRWRTESEVISGAGETTCGNTRCDLHAHADERDRKSLKTVELPFSYVEDGENKFALVKVVLCDKCLKKLMWKRNKAKEKEREREKDAGAEAGEEAMESDRHGWREIKQELRDDKSMLAMESSRKRRSDVQAQQSAESHNQYDSSERSKERKRHRRHSRSPSPPRVRDRGNARS